jgi:hypothetical protein
MKEYTQKDLTGTVFLIVRALLGAHGHICAA